MTHKPPKNAEAARQWMEANVSVPVWPQVVRNAIVWFVLLYVFIAIPAYHLIRWLPLQEHDADIGSAETATVSQEEMRPVSEYESRCDMLVGTPFENCLTEGIIKAEDAMDLMISQILANAHAILNFNYAPESNELVESWKEAILLSQVEWPEYRDSTCNIVHYLMWPGSGIGRSIQSCRLRMTVKRIDDIQRYGNGFPDYY